METSKWLSSPIILEGKTIRLIPLEIGHEEDLIDAASDGKLWELWFTGIPSPSTVNDYLKNAFNQKKDGTGFAFVVIEKRHNKIIGSTRFLNASIKNKRIEIGSTWYSKSHQNTIVNKECKLLLLEYAFEVLKCIAVEFRTHFHNHNSRRAIASLGAKQDGILRNHTYDKVGNIRDTVVFSIIESEWNVVKTALTFKLKQYLSQ